MSSPWGKIQHVEKLITGISFVVTAGHGGLRVSRKALYKYAINPELITRIAGIEQGNYVYFEEDCAFQVFMLDAPEILKLHAKNRSWNADETFKDTRLSVEKWFPAYFKDESEL